MGDIGTPYSAAPPAGLILTTGAANLNRDIYSVNGEQGLLSEPNGGLDDANLAAGFEITPEIILDFSYVRATADGDWAKVDYHSDVFGEDATDPADAAHMGVWAVKARLHVPFPMKMIWFQTTFFRSLFRFRKREGADPIETTDFGVATRIAYRAPGADPVALVHSLRHHPTTAYPDTEPLGANGTNIQAEHESYTAESWHLSHMEFNVAKGFHEFLLELYMETTDGEASGSSPWLMKNMIGADGTAEDDAGNGIEVHLHNRISFGCRAAMCYALL